MSFWTSVLIVAIPISVLLAFFLVIKWSFAKTQKAYWTYLALFMLLGGLMMALVNASDFFPREKLAEAAKHPVPDPGQILAQLPVAQVVLLGLAGAVWVIGGNILIIWQGRKAGRSWWACLNPFRPIFRDFDAKAWKILGLLLLVGLALAMAGGSIRQEAPRGVLLDESLSDQAQAREPTATTRSAGPVRPRSREALLR